MDRREAAFYVAKLGYWGIAMCQSGVWVMCFSEPRPMFEKGSNLGFWASELTVPLPISKDIDPVPGDILWSETATRVVDNPFTQIKDDTCTNSNLTPFKNDKYTNSNL